MSKRPRLLKRSSKSSENVPHIADDHDAFELSADSLWSNHNHRPLRRPFPSSSLLAVKAASIGKQEQTSPLLQSYLASVGIQQQQEQSSPCNEQREREQQQQSSHFDQEGNPENNETKTREQQSAENNNDDDIVLASIDDPSRSCISHGQHQKYLELLSLQRQDWKAYQYKEFQKLNALVQEEQLVYRQALLEFWHANKDRVLLGFTKTPTRSISSSEIISNKRAAENIVRETAFPDSQKGAWKTEWAGVQYGKCRQVITLEQPRQADKKHRWMVDAIECEPIQQESKETTTTTTTNPSVLPPTGVTVPVPRTKHCPVSFLRHDEEALLLAKKHKVDIVTSLETLECLLKMEGANWMIPIVFQDDGVAILEIPLPRPFMSPRDCLSHGLEQGLEQLVKDNQQKVQAGGQSPPTSEQQQEATFRYAVMTVPQSFYGAASVTTGATAAARPKKPKYSRVLIRIPNQSIRAHSHVEYFPERGEEVLSSYERSLWILDHFLFSKSVVGRIDPSSSCTLMKWEETSVAHALAGGNSNESMFPSDDNKSSEPKDPMDHWHHLAQILQAMPTIGRSGNFLLCLPGRGNNLSPLSASVHMEITTHHGYRDGGDSIIDMEQELNRAGEVLLGSTGVSRSIRDWAWTEERIPFTFPIPTKRNS